VTSLCDAALRMMAAPEERERMAARSRQVFERRFRADRIYAEYADLVERLANQTLAQRAS
jgi:glycosyltransferase involved in cell wall biosynthesis